MKTGRGKAQALSISSAIFVFAELAAGGVGVWTSGGPRYGAQVSSIAVSHVSPTMVFAAASSGAEHDIFRSLDGGESWVPSGAGLPGNTFFFGLTDSGDGSALFVLAYDRGVFKSVDGGDHWTDSNGDLSEEDARDVRSLVLDPRNSSTLFLASGSKVFRSGDGGRTWSRLPMPEFFVNELAVDPFRSEILYAAGSGTVSGAPVGVLKTADGGMTWTPSSAGLPESYVESLSIEPGDPGVLYCSFANAAYRSIDSGAHWERIAFDFRGRSIVSVRADPYEIGTVYAIGFGGEPSGGGLFRSRDRGETWTPINAGLSDTYLVALAFEPGLARTFYVGSNVGGVSKSMDGGDSWRRLPLDLPARTLSLAADLSGVVVYAGAFPGIFRSTNGGATWEVRNAGLPAANAFVQAIAIDPSEPRKVYAAVSGYGVFHSADAGETWTGGGEGLGSLDLMALAIDPTAPSILYCATYSGGVFKSMDGGLSWKSSSAGLSSLFVASLAIDPAEPALVYAGTADGLFRSLDAGSTWTLASADVRDVSAVVVTRTSPSRIYAGGLSGYPLVRSLDGGATWERATSQLDFYDIWSLAVSSSSPSTLYAGTNAGTFRSTDAGVTWQFLSDRGAIVFALAVDETGSVLHAGGFGVWDHVEPCGSSSSDLCLLQGRFRLTLRATDPRSGRTASGHAITQGDRFGYFSLPDFTGDPAFPEVFVKMLDATSLPGGHYWLFHTGLTDLQYTLTAWDRATGAARTYRNDRSDPSELCGGADTSAFLTASPDPERQISGVTPTGVSTACVPDAAGLCLLSGRFRATLSAEDPRTGRVASGRAISQGDRFGYFSLPEFTGDAAFPEVFVKMLDATSLDGHFWVFHSGLTDLRYTLIVTDLSTGETRAYQNRVGDPTRLCGGADTAAFGN